MYAVGGASSSDYVLPTTDDAVATSAIALREGHSHGDLMAAQATVTLTDGGTNTVTLGMTRKTMLIQSVVVKKVPTFRQRRYQAVSVENNLFIWHTHKEYEGVH